MKLVYWLIFGWFAPFAMLLTLYFKVVISLFVTIAKVALWGLQKAFKVSNALLKAGITKIKEYKLKHNFNLGIVAQ